MVALVLGVAALGRAVGLVITGGRPWCTEDDAAAILDGLGRRERSVPVVIAPVVACEAGGDFHAQDIEPDLRLGAVETANTGVVCSEGLHGPVAACTAEACDGLLTNVADG